jgi:hypothetical protein
MQHCDALYKHCRGQLTHSSRLVLTEIFTANALGEREHYLTIIEVCVCRTANERLFLILFYFFDSLLQSACPPKHILPV